MPHMLRRLARWILRTGGWTMVGEVPDVPKAVFVVAPHTSNWDGLWALTYKVAVGADVHFFAKRSLFWFPLGNLLSALGGIPLDRSRAGSAVRQAISMFEREEHFFFGLAPEGTRSHKPGWKSGFYRIAQGANVPVYPAMLDYGQKRVGVGQRIELSGDQEKDLEVFRSFYADVRGRRPEKTCPVRFI